MKGLCLTVLLAALATASGADRGNYGGLEDGILSAIEMAKNQLKKGIPELNIPPLDPLNVTYQKIDLSFNDTLRLNGSLADVSGNNLLSFGVSKLKASVSPVTFAIRLDWGLVDVNGSYTLDGHLLNIIPIYGNGSFSGWVDGAFCYLRVDIGTKAGELRVKKLDVDFGIKNVSVSIENLMGGVLGDVICQVINENLPTMVEQFKIGYLEGIKNSVVAEINKFIKGKTIEDLLEFIFGMFQQSTTASPQISR